MNSETRILMVEDTVTDAFLIERELRQANINFISKRVEASEAFLRNLEEFQPDIVLSDFTLPQFSGLEALRLLKERYQDIPFILITGSLTEEVAVECMKEGAHDYILKTSLKRLPSAVLNALQKRKVEIALERSEEQLRQAQKLEAVGQLAGGVAHDFNNILTVISGYSEILMKKIAADDPNHARVQEIKRAAERASSLTRQLLAFSRKQVLQPKRFDLNSLVTDMSRMLLRLIGEDIDLVTVLTHEFAQINADPGQIEQVLMNLIVNARDAMPNGGKIIIETSILEMDSVHPRTHVPTKPGRYVMLGVTDNGLGIDEETQKHIFEPFYTTKKLGKGTGLGLSTVYGIVKQSGGYVWVNSEVGHGTSFKIYLPLDLEESEHLSSTTLHLVRGGETLLLVEDEPQIRCLAVEFLSECGYDILVASNGNEALEIVKRCSDRIELIITDVVMPHMSGRELAEQVSEINSAIKVLYMSGYTNDAILRHGVLESETWFIQKPFAPDALAAKVREILDGPQLSESDQPTQSRTQPARV